MKKTVLMAAAALFALCASVSGDELKINGEFKNLTKQSWPVNWHKNGAVKTAKCELVRQGDDNIIKIKNLKGYFALYNGTRIPVKVGDEFKFEIELKGKGHFSVGYYTYGKKGHCGTVSTAFEVNSPDKFTEYKGTFKIAPPYKGKDLLYMHVQFGSYMPIDIEVKEIEVEPVKAK